MTVSHNLQYELCVLQIVWVKQRRSTMVQYSFQEQAEMVFVYGQAGGNGREAAWMYRATYRDRQYHLHHTIFGAICVDMGPLRQANVQVGHWLCVHQVWRNMLSMILRTTIQASDPPTWCKPKDSYLYPTWQPLLSLSPPMCTGIIIGRFSSMGKIVTGLCKRPSPLWDFCLWSSSPMKQPLVAMTSLTCIIIMYGLQTILTEWLKHLISSSSASMCGSGLLATAYFNQFCFQNAWTEKCIWPSCKTHCLHCWRMYL